MINFKQKVTFITNPKEMKLSVLIEYYDSQDLKLFNVERKEHSGNYNAMVEFFGNLIELSENREIINRFGQMRKVMKLSHKYQTVKLLIWGIKNATPNDKDFIDEAISELKKFGYRINTKKDIFDQLDNIENRIENLISQIEIEKSKLKYIDQSEVQDIREQIINVTLGLEYPHAINPQHISVYEWELLKKALRKKIENVRNHHNSRKAG